ncbi:GNAT family N-acetyltransferase [Allopontixanthobacter sp.]|uniref:GNAT family N-acetyltransferase n=1 Tax=Allopontixanthobacter sp. TaxID=2906452 RepID=UPI002ABCFFE4|nr:GNAT family N-acetyltransferase [Allopontixanthobacter sp.]MDZ4307058.1 GNAT family N-acetyltransferase [Allopontixanthobacter sp.]
MASLPLRQYKDRDCQTAPVLGGGADGMSLVEWRDLADAAAITEWDELALEASEPNPFFESWNLLPALASLDQGRNARIAVFRSGGKLTGLMPLARSARYYGYPLPHWHNWLHHNCFCGLPLVTKGHETEFWAALLQTIDARPGGALFLHLTRLPTGGPVHAALMETLDRQPRPYAVVHSEQRAMLQSSKSPADYFAASMNGKKRKELRRQYSRLSELGTLQFCRHLDDQGIDQWCEDFLDLELAGWKGREGSALACEPGTASFFRSALHGGAARGRAERLSLSLDGRPIAMLVNFLAPPGSYSFKTAFDETYAQYSPGVLLQRENLDLLDRQGIDWCDSCASADHPMIERIWRQKRTIQRVSIGIGGALRQSFVRQLLRAESGRKVSA